MPADEAPVATRSEFTFALTVRLATAAEPWCATLSQSDRAPVRFDSPLDLVRHLGQLAPRTLGSGGLR